MIIYAYGHTLREFKDNTEALLNSGWKFTCYEGCYFRTKQQSFFIPMMRE